MLTGGGSGGGGDLGGMIFPRLLPPGEPTKPLTEDRGVECCRMTFTKGIKKHLLPNRMTKVK